MITIISVTAEAPAPQPKPAWLKIRPPTNTAQVNHIKTLTQTFNLHTVCQESKCPNIAECWSHGTATFMIMGDTCTRACKFCHVKTKFPAKPLDPDEPQKLAAAIKHLQLTYAVITSVTRDDLPDQGALHIAKCITELKETMPNLLVEILIPDFKGNEDCLKTIVHARPHVIAHNIETVKSLQRKVRDPRAGYDQSLRILRNVKELNPLILTKSSLMLGLGETPEEVHQAFHDLRAHQVDIVTLGQYLQPSADLLPVHAYITPDQFAAYQKAAEDAGFLYAIAGPFVRSSYRAGELFIEHVINRSAHGPH